VLTRLNDVKVEESMIWKLRLMLVELLVDLLKKVVLRVKLAKLMLVNESPENKRSNLGDMVDVGLKLKIEM
jgi:hypothetical protein